MTPNIQPVHRVRAEMLLVAEGELQSQIRSVGASGALGVLSVGVLEVLTTDTVGHWRCARSRRTGLSAA